MASTPKGERLPEAKARAVAALVEGKPIVEVAAAAGVNRTTLWRWMHEDEDFQAMRSQARQQLVDGVVADQVEALRALSPEAIEALQRGLHATVRQTVVKVGDGYEIVHLGDESLAVHTADLVLKRIPEFATKLDVQVSGTLEARLAELDAADS